MVWKNLKPYEIITQAETISFTLWFPNLMKSVHPVFHVSQLEPSISNTIPNCIQPLPFLIKIDGEDTTACCFTWCTGQDMKELMKKLLGCWPLSLSTPWYSSSTFMFSIWTNLDLTLCYNLFPFSYLLSYLCNMLSLLLLCSSIWGGWSLSTCLWSSMFSLVPFTLVLCLFTGLSLLWLLLLW